MYKLEKRYDEVTNLINTVEMLIDTTTSKDILTDLESLKYYYIDELALIEDEIFFYYTKQNRIVKKLYKSLMF